MSSNQQTATITLNRLQWAEIADQWRFYFAATPTGKLIDSDAIRSMNGLCRAIDARLATGAVELIDIEGPFAGWRDCANWILHVTLCGTGGGLAETGAAIAAQWAAQEPPQGVPAIPEGVR